MQKIFFYRAKDGSRPVADYILDLSQKKDKDSRIKIKKIQDYMNALSTYGLALGAPYIKHIEGDL